MITAQNQSQHTQKKAFDLWICRVRGRYQRNLLFEPGTACRNIHDDSLAVTVQCTSVRLLLNLVEIIYARRADTRTVEQYRGLLAKALDTFVSKVSVLRRSLPRLLSTPGESAPAAVCGLTSPNEIRASST